MFGKCQFLRGSEQLSEWNGGCGGGMNFIEELIVETKRNCRLKSLVYVLDDGRTVDCIKRNKHNRLKMDIAIHQIMAKQLVEMEIHGLENRVKLHCNGRRNLSVAEFLACFGIGFRIRVMDGEADGNDGQEQDEDDDDKENEE